ncbi:MAG: type I restriction endonuclease, partial [Lentisphaeraceae bacterium]|nr:type I restriction endonuclease [Lentisphaeraceae bacterium]
MKFTEAKLEDAIIQLLGEQGYPHVIGSALSLPVGEVLIKDDLRTYLSTQYAQENITASEIETIIRQLDQLSAGDLYESNKTIMGMLCNGFKCKREDHRQKDFYVYLMDFEDLAQVNVAEELLVAEDSAAYSVNKNILKIVNQLEIEGYEKRIPDGILY